MDYWIKSITKKMLQLRKMVLAVGNQRHCCLQSWALCREELGPPHTRNMSSRSGPTPMYDRGTSLRRIIEVEL